MKNGRHAEVAEKAIETLRAMGYFHEGETAVVVTPEDGAGKKWVARCDLSVLSDKPPTPERKKLFPSADPLCDILKAFGYRVSVCNDEENADPTFTNLEYYLYLKA